MTPAIMLDKVRKTYAGGVYAVHEVSLQVAEGTLLALLGPSGCGKTTTLRLIAGLERPDAGTVWISGRQVAGAGRWVEPEQRRVGLVFQDGALFPHLTIAENITFAFNRQQRAKHSVRLGELLALVGLEGLEHRYPHQLSGGQQQRVALARALALQPTVVLLDEPFANLDVTMRIKLREEVVRILRATATTGVLVTHDQQEALSLADQVALMLDGRIAQQGTPAALYTAPASRAVAEFIGETNWIAGVANGRMAETRLGVLSLVEPMHGCCELMIRPEQIRLCADPSSAWIIHQVRYFGHDQLVSVMSDENLTLQARIFAHHPVAPGERIALEVVGAVRAFPCDSAVRAFPS
ncbi:MAG: ABC transporter ATP-binding protein [Chloroflexaceae bacterium]